MLKKIGIVILTILLTANHNYAQVKNETVITENTNPLKGLRKADFKDLDPSKPLMLDGFSTPVYSENLELLKGEAFMKVMSTGDMIPDVFVIFLIRLFPKSLIIMSPLLLMAIPDGYDNLAFTARPLSPENPSIPVPAMTTNFPVDVILHTR